MKIFRISLFAPGAQTPMVVDAAVDTSGMADLYELLEQSAALKDEHPGMTVMCTDGKLRRFGANLIANSIIEIEMLDVPGQQGLALRAA